MQRELWHCPRPQEVCRLAGQSSKQVVIQYNTATVMRAQEGHLSQALKDVSHFTRKKVKVEVLRVKRRVCQRYRSVKVHSSQGEWQAVCAGCGSGPKANQGSGLERDSGLITMGLLCHLSSLCWIR